MCRKDLQIADKMCRKEGRHFVSIFNTEGHWVQQRNPIVSIPHYFTVTLQLIPFHMSINDSLATYLH